VARVCNEKWVVGCVKRLGNLKHLALDLDGTLYLGGRLFEWTVPFLETLARAGIGRTYFTNNSSKSTKQYVARLNELGIEAAARDVYSSTTSTIEFLNDEYAGARRLFVLGTPALREEFSQAGFESVEDPTAGTRAAAGGGEPDVVVVGFDTTLSYDRVCRAAWWISKGKPFIATHCDRVCPTDLPTILPDCAAICAMLTSATGREPDAVLGKPNPRMLGGLMKRHGLAAKELGVVGDRLYTDIAMAHGAGAMGILVLSGETTASQAALARPGADLVVRDVGELGRLIVREREALLV
jgi:NagD protein